MVPIGLKCHFNGFYRIAVVPRHAAGRRFWRLAFCQRWTVGTVPGGGEVFARVGSGGGRGGGGGGRVRGRGPAYAHLFVF